MRVKKLAIIAKRGNHQKKPKTNPTSPMAIIKAPPKTTSLTKPEFGIIENYDAIAKQLMAYVRERKLSTTFLTKAGPKEYVYLEGHLYAGKLFKTPILPRVEWTRPLTLDSLNAKGAVVQIMGWEARVSLWKGKEIISTADAACMSDEVNWKYKPTFQLRSMAQTRATGKAYRLIFGDILKLAGFEATPAEEMESVGTLTVIKDKKVKNISENDNMAAPVDIVETANVSDELITNEDVKNIYEETSAWAKENNLPLEAIKKSASETLKEFGFEALRDVPKNKIVVVQSVIMERFKILLKNEKSEKQEEN